MALLALIGNFAFGLSAAVAFLATHSAGEQRGTVQIVYSARGYDVAVCALRFVCVVGWLFFRKFKMIEDLREQERRREELARELGMKRDFYDSSIRWVHNSLQTFLLPLELMLKAPDKKKIMGWDVELGKISRLTGRIILAKIANILDLRRVGNKSLALNVRPENVRERIHELHGLFQVFAKAKGVDFVLSVETAMPDFILCDSTRLNQVLVNLLLNTFREPHQHGSEVALKVEWREEDSFFNPKSYPSLACVADCVHKEIKKDGFSYSSIDGKLR